MYWGAFEHSSPPIIIEKWTLQVEGIWNNSVKNVFWSFVRNVVYLPKNDHFYYIIYNDDVSTYVGSSCQSNNNYEPTQGRI